MLTIKWLSARPFRTRSYSARYKLKFLLTIFKPKGIEIRNLFVQNIFHCQHAFEMRIRKFHSAEKIARQIHLVRDYSVWIQCELKVEHWARLQASRQRQEETARQTINHWLRLVCHWGGADWATSHHTAATSAVVWLLLNERTTGWNLFPRRLILPPCRKKTCCCAI